MIHCVRLREVRAWLNDIGFQFSHKTAQMEYWFSSDTPFMFPSGNINDDIPEQTILSAAIASELAMPEFDVHWCD